jgi:hypothetical protein
MRGERTGRNACERGTSLLPPAVAKKIVLVATVMFVVGVLALVVDTTLIHNTTVSLIGGIILAVLLVVSMTPSLAPLSRPELISRIEPTKPS